MERPGTWSVSMAPVMYESGNACGWLVVCGSGLFCVEKKFESSPAEPETLTGNQNPPCASE